MSLTPELFDSGLPRNQTALLAKFYGDAAEHFQQMILHPPGGTDASREFRQARAAALIRQVEKIRRDLAAHAGHWVGREMRRAYADGVRRGIQQAVDAGVKPKGEAAQAGSFSLIDHRTVAILAADALADLNKAAASLAERTTRLLRTTAQMGLGESQIDAVLAGGVISGEPVAAIRQLREELRAVHGNKVQIIDRNGQPMNFEVKYYAQLVARTKTREATVRARHQRLQSLGLDLVSIVGRVSKNFCTAFLGQVFSLDGKSDKYPALSELPGGGPPFHPQCSKSTRPFVAELASDQQLRMADGLDDSDKLLNTTPAQAQRRFQDLQLYTQQRSRYASTQDKLFGSGKKAA